MNIKYISSPDALMSNLNTFVLTFLIWGELLAEEFPSAWRPTGSSVSRGGGSERRSEGLTCVNGLVLPADLGGLSR